MSREPSEQDYERLADIQGEKPPEPEPVQQDTDEEGGMDGPGYDPETGTYEPEVEREGPEPTATTLWRSKALHESTRELAIQEARFAERTREYERLSREWEEWERTRPQDRDPFMTPRGDKPQPPSDDLLVAAQVRFKERRLPVAPQPRGRRLKHGDARRGQFSGLFNSWRNMVQRCTNPKATGYEYYGAKGVGFDPRWWDYAAFKAYMVETWRPGRSLDRVDNALGYSPENCRWATRYQQTHNRGVKEPRTS